MGVAMTQLEPLECVLCGMVGPGSVVQVGLLRYQDARGNRYFDSDPRCKDHAACEARVRDAGGVWPLVPEPLRVTDRGLSE